MIAPRPPGAPMNTQPSLPEEITHQASHWFALLQAGSPTADEREALAQWLSADPRHAQAFARLEQLWTASSLALQQPAPGAAPTLSRRRFVGLSVAACAATVVVGASTLWLKGVGAPFADVRTAVGERRVVPLPDGSTVELAGNTALNLDFSATRRAVKLLQGEAFFTVVADPARDFQVTTDAGRIVARDGEFCLSCEGASALLAVSRKTARVLTVAQQTDLEEGLAVRFSASETGAIQHVDLGQVMAWRDGRLVFFDTPLAAVVNELERWREGKIFIADRQLAERRVSLILNLNRPEQMLDALAKALAVRTRRYTDLITVIHSV